MAENKDIMLKRLDGIPEEGKRKHIMQELLKHVEKTQSTFYDAFAPRRQRLLELNSIYRNSSIYDQNKVEWQTKSFLPLAFDAVETKTSMVHQALMGDKLVAPFSVIGKTPEDDVYASSAELVLNNTLDSIGFFETSEEVIRSSVKNGLGVYYYGWERFTETVLRRMPTLNEKGEYVRHAGKPILKFKRETAEINRPFVRSVDIVDHFGFDPTAKKIDKWFCDFAFLIDEMSPEQIAKEERRGNFFPGSKDRLKENDPHGLTLFGAVNAEAKEPRIRQQEGITDAFSEDFKPLYRVVRWFGWFDIDGDGNREFIEFAGIPEQKLILQAKERLMPEYPFVDIPFSRSLHSLISWGVLDPVLQLQYDINERRNQRGDAGKYLVSPVNLINLDHVLEDYPYIVFPGAQFPFHAGDAPLGTHMFQPVQWPTAGTQLSFEEEDRDIAQFSRTTGVADLNKVLNSVNKDTPASTVISIFNQQQAGSSMIINGILNRHGVLGSRVLRQIQFFGDEEFTVRCAGRKGLEFRRESLANILGDYDVKVTTNTFFGNKALEVQNLIQLRQSYVDAPHIDLVELDKIILEQIIPKRVYKVVKAPDDPLTPQEEMVLFFSGQGEGVKINMQEDIFSLQSKLDFHLRRTKPTMDKMAEFPEEQAEFRLYLEHLGQRITQLEQLQQQQTEQGQGQTPPGTPPGTNGALPQVNQIGQNIRPKPNNIGQ